MNIREIRAAMALENSKETFKKQAHALQKSGQTNGLSYCQILDKLVKELGFSNWNEYCSYLTK